MINLESIPTCKSRSEEETRAEPRHHYLHRLEVVTDWKSSPERIIGFHRKPTGTGSNDNNNGSQRFWWVNPLDQSFNKEKIDSLNQSRESDSPIDETQTSFKISRSAKMQLPNWGEERPIRFSDRESVNPKKAKRSRGRRGTREEPGPNSPTTPPETMRSKRKAGEDGVE